MLTKVNVINMPLLFVSFSVGVGLIAVELLTTSLVLPVYSHKQLLSVATSLVLLKCERKLPGREVVRYPAAMADVQGETDTDGVCVWLGAGVVWYVCITVVDVDGRMLFGNAIIG